jgi:UDP-N-acetylglucosamine:LPS N-acetylglucosamine transferase
MKHNSRKKRALAVASSGGHWTQLLRIIPAFGAYDVAYVTVLPAYRSSVPENRFYVVKDATRWNKLHMLVCALQMAWILVKERPKVVISTGAAPGYFAVVLGRWFGARTIWVDSIANADHISMAGMRVGGHADLWLTQWPHLARPEGPHYGGAVL